MSYHEAQYSELSLDKSQLSAEETLTVSLQIKNNSDFAGEETVQLYLRDLVGEVVRPIKELKGFQKVWLEPGETKEVTFSITEDMLRYVHSNQETSSDAGTFQAMVGSNSRDLQMATFKFVR